LPQSISQRLSELIENLPAASFDTILFRSQLLKRELTDWLGPVRAPNGQSQIATWKISGLPELKVNVPMSNDEKSSDFRLSERQSGGSHWREKLLSSDCVSWVIKDKPLKNTGETERQF